ncbi:MAG: DUF262 domain-containing protein [Nitrospirae bacterium]|nr:DUF262 domain-containing protein [Nitrospirota bacterium]MDE3041580.1 DUF262 domain-containing protein [Nitrospirota bacterium]
MNLNPNARIHDVADDIGRGLYRIPSIQRGYEWGQQRALKLLDSIMNGYPIGAIMVWIPSDQVRMDIPSRLFVAAYDSKRDYLTDLPHEADSLESYLVLDGQQRLQSLYLAFKGSYDGERVYMEADYEPLEESNGDFGFHFLSAAEARKRPEMVHLADVIKLDSDTKYKFVDSLARRLSERDVDPQQCDACYKHKQRVIAHNIDCFIDQFNIKPRLLLQEIDRRQDYDHVLEIFERVNSAGMVLSKSDLLFSTIKLKLREMEGKCATTLDFLNQGDRHNFNTDFLIKAALVIFEQKAKYEVKKLRDDNFVRTLKDRYDELHACLRQLLAWLDDVALIKCGRFLRSQLALIPILDYMMFSGRRDKPDGENGLAMREYLYMSFFFRTFSRSADAVLDKIHEKMSDAVRNEPSRFPIQLLRAYLRERAGGLFYGLQDHHFAGDADLVLNIVDGGVLQIDPADPSRHPKDLKLEVDHIFPRTPLAKLGMDDVVDHIGNYRLIVMPANRRKLAKMPGTDTAFFGRTNPEVESAHQAAINDLNRPNFVKFRDTRASLIQTTVKGFLRLPAVAVG